jgi:hypothetical protein
MFKMMLLLGLVCAGSALAADEPDPRSHAPAYQQSTAPVVETFDVFVDPESRYVFVKMPKGWTFVGQLSETEVRALPARVLTSLLPASKRLEARR